MSEGRATSEFDDSGAGGLIPQLADLLKVLLASPVRGDLLLLTLTVALVVIATVYAQIALNAWNQPFYDALAHRRFDRFITQLGVFAQIAGVLLILNVVQRWLNLMIKLKSREGLAHDLVAQWLKPQHAFRLAFAGSIGVNPDQRLHEDTNHLTELMTDLGIGFFQASVLMVSFIAVLWTVSGTLSFSIMGHDIAIPGYMVIGAVIYASSASLLTYLTGRRLIPQNAGRYSREAALRSSLMRVNEHINAISVSAGELNEQRRIGMDLRSVLDAMRSLVATLTNLTWVTAGYGWFTLVAPIIVAAPMYFDGHLTFGGLMMAVGAFNQVQTSLRWYVDNFSTIADWRATLFRVVSFRNAAIAMEVLDGGESHISLAVGEPGKLILDNVEIASPGGCISLREGTVEIKAGERIMIVGAPRSGKTLLFYTLSGLWPWGGGSITLPKGETILHVPRIPYLPHGTLREVIAYPSNVSNFKASQFIDALAHLGLQRLTPMLDSVKAWHSELSADEQQKVAFSRALLERPAWILIDEALESLYRETRQQIKDVLAHELDRAAIIYIGRTDAHDEFYARVFHIQRDPTRSVITPWVTANPSAKPLTGSQQLS